VSIQPPVTSPRAPQTLHERLAARAAGIRGRVHGCVGDRPYRVDIVVTEWPEGEQGRGREVEILREPLRSGFDCQSRPVPPKVTLSGTWSKALNGVVEQGVAVLEELDPTYTEAQLVNYGRVSQAQETSVEIYADERDGAAPDRPVRKFTINGVPFRDARRFGWVLKLSSQEASAPFGNGQLSPTGRLL
jgi:hypothetical protein